MEFCPKCKSLMMVQGSKAICRKCGYEEASNGKQILFVSKGSREEVPVVEDKIKTLPTVKVVCPECGNREAYWWLRQLRAADESEVRFFRCTKCGKTWRRYD
jgi:DNA-directed RNA polymerase subunit M